MRNMLAVWREHGVDETMRSAWERGIVLAGLSAAGLGLLEGSMSVHLDGEPERLPVYRQAVATGEIPPGSSSP